MATKKTTRSSTTHYTPRELAEELGLNQRAVRRMIRAGKLEASTKDDAGARWLISAAEAKRLAAELAK